MPFLRTIISLSILLAGARLGGALFARLRQPRVVGEILGGLVLGPSVLAGLAPTLSEALRQDVPMARGRDPLVDAVETLGLLALMFCAGAGTGHRRERGDRRALAWMVSVGTALPFAAVALLVPVLPLDAIAGPARERAALVLVLGIATAVTSIPVIARIFQDLGIIGTRFARIALGVAMIEDVALWVVLGVATSLASAAELPVGEMIRHLALTLAYAGAALGPVPALLHQAATTRMSGLVRRFPLTWIGAVLLAHTLGAWACGVSPVFAAFFAGLGLVRYAPLVAEALDAVRRWSSMALAPLYLAIVGFRVELTGASRLGAIAALMVTAVALKLAAATLGARLAGFRGISVVNLAVATNARGGPGIVVASVAHGAGIVNGDGYTALVALALVTSQAAGVWLSFVLRRGWPLLTAQLPARSVPPAAPAAR